MLSHRECITGGYLELVDTVFEGNWRLVRKNFMTIWKRQVNFLGDMKGSSIEIKPVGVTRMFYRKKNMLLGF